MKYLIICILFLVELMNVIAVSAEEAGQPDEWATYQNLEGGFSVDMPGVPEEKIEIFGPFTEERPNKKYIVSNPKEGYSYFVMYFDRHSDEIKKSTYRTVP